MVLFTAYCKLSNSFFLTLMINYETLYQIIEFSNTMCPFSPIRFLDMICFSRAI